MQAVHDTLAQLVMRLVPYSCASADCEPVSGLTAVCHGLQTVKMGVQYSLWGGSIVNLGSERHKKQYLEDIDQFRLPGEM